MEDVQSLVKILKLVEVKEPSTFLLPLLDLICESGSNPFFLSELHIICPCNATFHKIKYNALLLLEEVEGAFGTILQNLLLIKNGSLGEPDIAAINSRMSREETVDTEIVVVEIQINDNSVHAFINLLRARKVYFHLPVFEGIGEESWKVLGQALRGKTNIELRWVSILRQDLKEAIMEDIMVVWDIAHDFGVVNVNTQDMRIGQFIQNRRQMQRQTDWKYLAIRNPFCIYKEGKSPLRDRGLPVTLTSHCASLSHLAFSSSLLVHCLLFPACP